MEQYRNLHASQPVAQCRVHLDKPYPRAGGGGGAGNMGAGQKEGGGQWTMYSGEKAEGQAALKEKGLTTAMHSKGAWISIIFVCRNISGIYIPR